MRAVLAEDLFLLRDGLVRLPGAHDFEIAAAVEDAPGLLQALFQHRPDAAVVDVRLPTTFTDDGLRAARSSNSRRQRTATAPIFRPERASRPGISKA